MPAKAVAQSTDIPTDPPPSQASQLPQGIGVRCAIACSSNLLLGCGSSRARARQRWRWFSQPIYQLTLSHRSQASPHLCLEMHTPVGAGLLAKALCQSTHIPTDTPPSQASQPHLCLEMHSPVGAGLPAKAVAQSTHLSTDTPHRQTNPHRRFKLSCQLIGGSAARRIPYGASTGTGQTGRTW